MIGRRGSRPASIEENSGSVGRTFPLERDTKIPRERDISQKERERKGNPFMFSVKSKLLRGEKGLVLTLDQR